MKQFIDCNALYFDEDVLCVQTKIMIYAIQELLKRLELPE